MRAADLPPSPKPSTIKIFLFHNHLLLGPLLPAPRERKIVTRDFRPVKSK
jgi:hypothetical protein